MVVGTSSEDKHTGFAPGTTVCSTIAVVKDFLLLLHRHGCSAVEEAGVPTRPAASRSTAATKQTSKTSSGNRIGCSRKCSERNLSLARTDLKSLVLPSWQNTRTYNVGVVDTPLTLQPRLLLPSNVHEAAI